MKPFLGSSIIGLIYAAENQAYLKQDTQRGKEETWGQVFFNKPIYTCKHPVNKYSPLY